MILHNWATGSRPDPGFVIGFASGLFQEWSYSEVSALYRASLKIYKTCVLCPLFWSMSEAQQSVVHILVQTCPGIEWNCNSICSVQQMACSVGLSFRTHFRQTLQWGISLALLLFSGAKIAPYTKLCSAFFVFRLLKDENEQLQQQLRETVDENGRLYKLLKERDFEIKQLQRKIEEERLAFMGKQTCSVDILRPPLFQDAADIRAI